MSRQRGIREPAGDGGVGFPAQRGGEDGTAGLGPARPAEAIPVAVNEPGVFVTSAGDGMPTQPRSDVTAAARLEVDCRFSADAFPSRVFCRSGEREVEGPVVSSDGTEENSSPLADRPVAPQQARNSDQLLP